ncbi:hypothetical protein Gferi_03645 [Geosporobacter ferrireducens]|jgi:uncharacterized phage-like protein YoqJ|uniref:DUF1273 family protein n=2 Tax=Geosporobacter ferrireducens TaxID=1424294 RepID=A0A1D8GCX0_9FIRM|nr:hypothetical protein Gferi_03645 [Geosporobacter ferrireducens]
MKDMKTVCVTGPREIPKNKIEYVRQELQREIEQAIADGFTRFLSSMSNNVDLDFAAIVAKKKKQYPELYVEAVIPYSDRVKSKDKRFQELMPQCSGVKVISNERDRDCYFARNRYLVEKSERVIAVSDGKQKSDAAQTLRMAAAKGLELRIIDISDERIE